MVFADSEDRSEMESVGPQDYVLSTLKGHGLLPALPDIQPLLGVDTTFVTLHNGLPFFYFYGGGPGCPPELEGRPLECLDPDGCKCTRNLAMSGAAGALELVACSF